LLILAANDSMANVVSFTVNDTSPSILYSPFGDTFSIPNLSAGWNPYYTLSGYASGLGGVGNGTSLHITSDNGSSLVVQWHGTGIQLYGNATSASYSITLDGAPYSAAATSDNNLLVSITNLPDAPHAVTLTATIPEPQNPPNSSLVVFENAVLTSSPAPLNVSFSSQAIDDDSIAFLGRWSFDTTPTGAFHSSHSLGDRAVASFNGTTFLLHGVTSPSSGNYTVTVDNVTTTLSARSSFTAYDSLLFYTTGLDSASTHYVQVSNSGGGNLSLLVGGFNTFAPYSTIPSPPLQTSPASGVDQGFSKGTIAAFVLSGILASIVFCSLIYYFFYRPRRRRQRLLAESENWSPKEREAGVIDIGPEVDKTEEVGSANETDRDSGGNGFSRWKRGAVDGSPGELSLPIRFRRSNSLNEKVASPMNEVQPEQLSDLATNSSAKPKDKSKSKGKARQIFGRSWSPGRIFDINHSRRLQHLSANTAISTFIAAEPSTPKNVAPPSYAASVSIRDSRSTTNANPAKSSSNRSMPSVPHSVSLFPDDQDRSYPPQKQDNTGAILLPQGELNSEQESSADSSPHRLKLPQAIPMNSLPRVDRDNEVEDNVDDTLPVSLQQAIRSFSPRPVRHPYANQDEDSIQTPSPRSDNFLEDAALTMLPESPSNNDDLVEVRDGVFLGVSPSSPFQVTFDHLPAPSEQSNSGELSYVSTPSASKPAINSHSSSEPPNPDDGTGPMQTSSDFLQGPSNMRFRLTPLTIPPTLAVDPPSKSSNGDSEGVMSFLDFNSSREGSLASRSIWSEERRRSNLDPPVELKSRWSNTTVPSLKSKSSHYGNNSNAGASDGSNKTSEPQSVHSSTYPIPIHVSIPSSSDHSIMSARPSRISGLTTGDTLHIHPPFESLESPTESTSIPMSAVSELHFRQSVSEDNVEFNSRRTTESSLVFVSSSHPPPLPTRPDENTPRPFDPSILVNRVLGLSSHPTTTARAATASTTTAYPSPPISSLSPFVSPHTSRLMTDTRGDRSQNSGTDSLGP